MVGFILFGLSGLALWGMFVMAMIEWFGTLIGIVAAVIAAPVAYVFPLVYWLVEGTLHLPATILWVVAAFVFASCGIFGWLSVR